MDQSNGNESRLGDERGAVNAESLEDIYTRSQTEASAAGKEVSL